MYWRIIDEEKLMITRLPWQREYTKMQIDKVFNKNFDKTMTIEDWTYQQKKSQYLCHPYIHGITDKIGCILRDHNVSFQASKRTRSS